MDANLTATRQAAEAAFAADPSDANLKALQVAGKAEMDAYLVDFDARQAARQEATETAEQEAEEAPSSPALTTKAAEDIKVDDVILTQYGWVVVTYWNHHFARPIDLNTQWNEREITRVYINRIYSFEAGTQVTVHANPKGFTHERFQASRRLMQAFKTEARQA